jgi:large subunit ribosomal protein L33
LQGEKQKYRFDRPVFLYLEYLQHLSHLLVCIYMAKRGDKRKIIGMVSEESGERLYYTTKNTMNTPDKLSLKKYSPKLRKHVVFTETKKNLGRNEAPKR